MTSVMYIFKDAPRTEGHMRVSREKANENREKIVETAWRLFREHGFDGIGVDAIMKRAGLTHGGFYGHFKSKDDLATQAVTRAFARATERMSRVADLKAYAADYLSEEHRADRGGGRGVAALASEIGRAGKGVRREV